MSVTISFSSSVKIEERINLSEDYVERILQSLAELIFSDSQIIAMSDFSDSLEDEDLEAEIGFYFCDDEEMQELNLKYRDLDAPTDVLSFSMQDEDTSVDLPVFSLGEVIIYTDKLAEQARQNEHSNLNELIILASHGVLHLLGIHHETSKELHDILDIQQRLLEAILDYYE